MSQSVTTEAVKSKKGQSFLTKVYLFAYNSVQLGGWSYILYQLVYYYLLAEPAFRESISFWDYTALRAVIIFQNAAAMEIFNAALGLVKSNLFITFFQVLSRMIVVFGAVMATPTGKMSVGLPISLMTWSIAEIIRYGYYALNILQIVPQTVVWLRYTMFIALYPIGVVGEMLCFWAAQDYARTHDIWSLDMPNEWNVTFSYFYFLWMVILLYIPFFPLLYWHMFTQRKNVLGAGKSHLAKKNSKRT